MKTLTQHKFTRSLLALAFLAFSSSAHAATVIPITSFDPNTFFSGGITAGIDFDVNTGGSPPTYVTQSGFLSVVADTAKSYNVTHNGITFDIVTRNNNLANQGRFRNNDNAGDLMNDFQQFFGDTAGSPVEMTLKLTGLVANLDYEIGFFTANVGAGQTTHSFFEGASISDPLITTFTTSGNQNTYSTWSPGVIFLMNSGNDGEISVTIQATQNTGGNEQSRLTLDGISVVAIPEPSVALLGGLGILTLLRRRR